MSCFTVGLGGPEGSASPAPEFPAFEAACDPFFGFGSLVELVNTMKLSSWPLSLLLLLALVDFEDFLDDDPLPEAWGGGAVAFSFPFFPILSHEYLGS